MPSIGKKLIFILGACCLLTACTSKTRVHIYGKYLSPEQAQIVSKELREENYQVKVNVLPFPESIATNTLVYAALANENHRVSDLISYLSQLGYDIESIRMIGAQNHEFTHNNVGLYLLPPGYVKRNEVYTIPLASEYGSTTCQDATNLRLLDSQKFEIEVEIWQEQAQDYSEVFYYGTWQAIDSKNIRLTFDKAPSTLDFARSIKQVTTPDGDRQVVSLTPLMKSPVNELAGINCTYTISLAF